MYKNLYCRVFINSKLEIEELYNFINSIVLGRMEAIRTIKTDWGEIDLRKNKDYNDRYINNFIYWPYCLDIEPSKKVEQSIYILNIEDFLKKMKMSEIAVVAACDFESEL